MSLLKTDKCCIPFSDVRGEAVSVQFLWHSDDLNISDGYFFSDPVEVNVEITVVEGNYLADVHSSGNGVFLCHRCGETFNSRINGKVKSLYTFDPEQIKGEEDGDCHLIPASGKGLDITQDALDALLLGLPVKTLCSKNCKGLCGQCGANLNKEDCKCTGNVSDSRWDDLKNIKFDK